MNIEPRLPHDRENGAAKQIAEMLTLATEQMDRHTCEALRQARNTALDRLSARTPSLVLDVKQGEFLHIPHSPRQWAAAALMLAVFAVGIGYWQHQHKRETMAHLDVAILTDDMPLEVFIDHGSE